MGEHCPSPEDHDVSPPEPREHLATDLTQECHGTKVVAPLEVGNPLDREAEEPLTETAAVQRRGQQLPDGPGGIRTPTGKRIPHLPVGRERAEHNGASRRHDSGHSREADTVSKQIEALQGRPYSLSPPTASPSYAILRGEYAVGSYFTMLWRDSTSGSYGGKPVTPEVT